MINLKKKRFISLISPEKIDNKEFFNILERIFSLKKVKFFQLRLKSKKNKKIVKIGKKIKKICKKHRVKFLINDNPNIAKQIGADGCHIGQNDTDINRARKILKNKIIGVTCHNSMRLLKNAVKNSADYVALGSFYKSNTKKVKFKANIMTLKSAKKITKIPLVAIGGINSKNYKKLLLNKANFLAISSYVWKNKKLNPVKAIRTIK